MRLVGLEELRATPPVLLELRDCSIDCILDLTGWKAESSAEGFHRSLGVSGDFDATLSSGTEREFVICCRLVRDSRRKKRNGRSIDEMSDCVRRTGDFIMARGRYGIGATSDVRLRDSDDDDVM